MGPLIGPLIGPQGGAGGRGLVGGLNLSTPAELNNVGCGAGECGLGGGGGEGVGLDGWVAEWLDGWLVEGGWGRVSDR